MKNKCGTCDKALQAQSKYCSRQCANIGANKARVLAMKLTETRRFWAKVHKTDDCWIWQGAIGNSGYGQVKIDGKVQLAHRVTWTFKYGDPGELCVLHKCDNPPCVRPDHLFIGTKQDNSDDMVNKGRSYNRHGSKNPNNKLTPEQITEIRNLKGKAKQVDIARKFGINQTHVSRIFRGEVWKLKH